jgi:hypothetical protein
MSLCKGFVTVQFDPRLKEGAEKKISETFEPKFYENPSISSRFVAG